MVRKARGGTYAAGEAAGIASPIEVNSILVAQMDLMRRGVAIGKIVVAYVGVKNIMGMGEKIFEAWCDAELDSAWRERHR